MAHSNVLVVCTIIAITNLLCKGDYTGLVVGPRTNETGRYIYSSQPNKEATASPKHCLYCNNDVAFYNTSMNKIHQEIECIMHYNRQFTKITDGLSEYERTNNLNPFCKLGVVPGCGRPPNKELYCAPGYSNVPYSVYFSCVTADDETMTSLSEYYCNELLHWVYIGEHTNNVDTTRSPPSEETKNEMAGVFTERPGRVIAEEKPKAEIKVDGTTIRVIIGNTEENTDGTALYVVIVIVACVLFLITLISAAALGRYVYKRKRTRFHPGSSSVSSTKPSPLSPQFVRYPQEHCGKEGPFLVHGGDSYTSNQSSAADVEGDNSLNTTDIVTPTVVNTREPPLGQEHVPLLKVDLTKETCSKAQPMARSTYQPLVQGFMSCPAELLRANGAVEQAFDPITHTQQQTNRNKTAPLPPRPNNKIANDSINYGNLPTDNRRQEPIGKVSDTRHEDERELEENSQNTEPKRVVSMGLENDASFEITAPDSGINLGALDSVNTTHAEVGSLRINNLK